MCKAEDLLLSHGACLVREQRLASWQTQQQSGWACVAGGLWSAELDASHQGLQPGLLCLLSSTAALYFMKNHYRLSLAELASAMAMKPTPSEHDMLDRTQATLSLLKPEALSIRVMPRYMMDCNHEGLQALSGSEPQHLLWRGKKATQVTEQH